MAKTQRNECEILVDFWADLCYTKNMMKKRTARKDSNYVIYLARDQRGETYVGLTRKGERTVSGAVKERWRKHLSRARNETRLWALYVYLKTGGLAHSWEHEVLAVIRGRREAYAWERDWVKANKPSLNDQYL